MVLLEISQADLTTLDSTPWAEVPAATRPCDSCRHALAFSVIRVGSVTEQVQAMTQRHWFQTAAVFVRTMLHVPVPVVIYVDALQIAALLTDEHLKVSATCPHCFDPVPIEIFLNPSK